MWAQENLEKHIIYSRCNFSVINNGFTWPVLHTSSIARIILSLKTPLLALTSRYHCYTYWKSPPIPSYFILQTVKHGCSRTHCHIVWKCICGFARFPVSYPNCIRIPTLHRRSDQFSCLSLPPIIALEERAFLCVLPLPSRFVSLAFAK